MQRKLLSLSLAIVILFLAACGSAAQSTAESSAPQRWMTVVYTEGLVEAQENSGGEWQALNTGQRVAPGASLRTATGSLLHVEINDGSAFIAGPESLITVAQFSPELENTLTTLDLQQGAVFVVAMNSSMGKSGAFEIKTATLTLTITSPEVGALRGRGLAVPARMPSGYVGSGIVTIVKGKTPQEAATQVGMLSGNGTITLPGGDTRAAQLDQYIQVNNNTDEIQIIPPDLMDEAELLGTYNLNRLLVLLTGTPAFTPTASRTSLPATAAATWTPFPTYSEPTETLTPNPLPTHRPGTPDPNWTPGPDGLTQEESANAGSHTYSHSCVPYGECICSPDSSVPGFITFTAESVTLAGDESGSDSITYGKDSPNVYSLSQGDIDATITFFIDGWDFVVNKGGASCSFQTFLLQ